MRARLDPGEAVHCGSEAMRTFEYMFLTAEPALRLKCLNQLGAEGWQIVAEGDEWIRLMRETTKPQPPEVTIEGGQLRISGDLLRRLDEAVAARAACRRGWKPGER